MRYAPTLTVDCIGSFCQPSDLDAHQTSPTRGRMRFLGCVDGAFVWVVWALPFVCHGVGASPHRPPPPFLVLTQEKEAKEGQGYGHPS